MKRGEKRLTYVAVFTAVATGFAYGYLDYFCETEDDFGPVIHEWQPTAHWLHVVVVPLFVFALGLLWPHHIVAKLKSGAPARRRTGLFLVLTAIPMILSGYAVQVCVDESWRTIWAWTHGVVSVLFTAGFAVHLKVRLKRS